VQQVLIKWECLEDVYATWNIGYHSRKHIRMLTLRKMLFLMGATMLYEKVRQGQNWKT